MHRSRAKRTLLTALALVLAVVWAFPVYWMLNSAFLPNVVLQSATPTFLPFGGSFYASPEHESARATVNQWIRESGQFDAVIDLDAAMRDPADPTKLRAEVDGGDHLHPNELGYRLMADAVDLGLFAIP